MTRLCAPICTDRPTDCIPCATDILPAQFDLAFDAAEQIVHEFLGRRYGFCQDTIQACVGAACSCPCACDQCRRFKIVVHDRMPIVSIDTATVTPFPTPGNPTPTPVAITGLTVQNFNEITFPVGTTALPEGVIDITFTYGKDFPLGTCIAVRDLAAQLVAAISCQCECSLPARVVSYVKGDTAFTFIDPEVLAELRLSGIASLDTLIRAFGGNKRPTVYSPDIHRSECVRWTRVTA